MCGRLWSGLSFCRITIKCRGHGKEGKGGRPERCRFPGALIFWGRSLVPKTMPSVRIMAIFAKNRIDYKKGRKAIDPGYAKAIRHSKAMEFFKMEEKS